MFISLLFGATYGAEYLKKLLFTPSKEAELKIIPISLLDKDKIQINKEIKVEKKDMIAATPVVTVQSGNVSGMLNTVEMNAVPGFEKEVIAVNSVEVNGGDLVDEDWEVVAATPVVTVEWGNVSGMLNSVEMNEMITNSLLDWEIIEEKPVFPQLI